MIFTAFEIWITVKNTYYKDPLFQNSEYFFYFFIASKFSTYTLGKAHTHEYNVCWKILSCRYCSPMGRKNILSILLCSRPWRSWVVGVLCREPQLIRLESFLSLTLFDTMDTVAVSDKDHELRTPGEEIAFTAWPKIDQK